MVRPELSPTRNLMSSIDVIHRALYCLSASRWRVRRPQTVVEVTDPFRVSVSSGQLSKKNISRYIFYYKNLFNSSNIHLGTSDYSTTSSYCNNSMMLVHQRSTFECR